MCKQHNVKFSCGHEEGWQITICEEGSHLYIDPEKSKFVCTGDDYTHVTDKFETVICEPCQCEKDLKDGKKLEGDRRMFGEPKYMSYVFTHPPEGNKSKDVVNEPKVEAQPWIRQTKQEESKGPYYL